MLPPATYDPLSPEDLSRLPGNGPARRSPIYTGVQLEGLGPLAGRLVPFRALRGPFPWSAATWLPLQDVVGNQWLVIMDGYDFSRQVRLYDRGSIDATSAAESAVIQFWDFRNKLLATQGWEDPPLNAAGMPPADRFQWGRQRSFERGVPANTRLFDSSEGGPMLRDIAFDLSPFGFSTTWWEGWMSGMACEWTRTAVFTRITGVNQSQLRWESFIAHLNGVIGGMASGGAAGQSAGQYGAMVGAIIGGVAGGFDAPVKFIQEQRIKGQQLGTIIKKGAEGLTTLPDSEIAKWLDAARAELLRERSGKPGAVPYPSETEIRARAVEKARAATGASGLTGGLVLAAAAAGLLLLSSK